jgi:hypothetical protein
LSLVGAADIMRAFLPRHKMLISIAPVFPFRSR